MPVVLPTGSAPGDELAEAHIEGVEAAWEGHTDGVIYRCMIPAACTGVTGA